ncbi:MAG: hemerythrin domain-containing protein [Candidatus Binataceae bacterium]
MQRLRGCDLTRNPESRELGTDTFRIWKQIAPILSRHLDAEDTKLLPWLEQQGARASTVGGRARECHHQLRTLMGAIANSGADHLTEAQARDAGQAMSGLAITLDDAIDDEERRLFPMIRKALVANARRD